MEGKKNTDINTKKNLPRCSTPLIPINAKNN